MKKEYNGADKYLLIKIEGQRRYKISYIYYGDVFNGLRVSKTIDPRHNWFEIIKETIDALVRLACEKQKSIKKYDRLWRPCEVDDE